MDFNKLAVLPASMKSMVNLQSLYLANNQLTTLPSYVGDFKEGERTGQGILYFIDGTKYIGEWLNNKQHGQGILYSADGEVLTEGNWQNDSFDA